MTKEYLKKDSEELTRFEKARIIGSRALQISEGAPILVKLSKKELEEIRYNPIEIARKEFEANLIPITVKRNLPTESDKEDTAKEK